MSTSHVATCLMFLILIAGPGRGFAAAADAGADGQQLYQSATKALDESNWELAARQFGQAASVKGDHQDGALYWRAYAQNKLGLKDEAIEGLGQLESQFPKSRWLKDARALRLAINPGSDADADVQGDDDLKLLAINSLMSSDPERAVGLLEKILQRNASPKVQERALFVLSQNKAPKARQIIADVARGKFRPELQLKAIQYLGVSGGTESRRILSEVYPSATPDVKKRILQSFMVSGDKEKILTAAKSEKVKEVRAAAIQQLGVMGARAELYELYSAESEAQLKKAIINGLFLSSDVDRLVKVAREDKDPALRREAANRLGLFPASKSGEALVGIYRSEKDTDSRRRVLDALFIQNNAPALINIAENEKDPQLRKRAVEKLSLMHSKEAQDYMMKVLEK